MKKLLIYILSLLPIIAKADVGDINVNGIWYRIAKGTNNVEVVKNYTTKKYAGRIVIPKSIKYNGVVYNVTSIGKNAFSNCRDIISITIPNSVTSIGGWAFDSCTNLLDVHIGDNVTTINDGAFLNCNKLTTIAIPPSVSFIGDVAFKGCVGLNSVHIKDLATWCNSTFYDNPLDYAHHLFINNKEVNNLIIPNGVTSISNKAFKGCSNLSSVIFSNSVKTIGVHAFSGCSGLTEITIPKNINLIENFAFYGCSKLKIVTIQNDRIRMGNGVFRKCDELTDVFLHSGNMARTSFQPFSGAYIEYITLHVPASSIDSYKAYEPWKNFEKIVALENTVSQTENVSPTIATDNEELDKIINEKQADIEEQPTTKQGSPTNEISKDMEMPSFPGGVTALISWLGNNLQYPAIAEENGIQGLVICSFIVECDGSISDIQVVSGVDPSLDKEAVRVIKQMPQWKPGKKNGDIVRVRHKLPINFKLPETARNKNNSVSSNSASQTNASQDGTVSASTGIYKQEIQDDYDYWHKQNEIAHKRAIEEGQAKVYFDTVEENTEEKVAKERQSLETKYGKKYVDALYNGKILVGTPEELILKHTNSTLKSEDLHTRKYWIDNLLGRWAWTVWVNKKTKKVSSVTYH